MQNTTERAKVKCLSAGARTQLLVAKAASFPWANTLLKHYDAVLGKVKDIISFEFIMVLSSTPLSNLTELFGTLERTVEKFSWVPHDVAIQKAVAMDKKQQNSVKNLQFSQFACWR